MEKYVKIDGIEYRVWTNLLELVSKENNVKKGDVRVIEDLLFYAYYVNKQIFAKNSIMWKLYNYQDKDKFNKVFGD